MLSYCRKVSIKSVCYNLAVMCYGTIYIFKWYVVCPRCFIYIFINDCSTWFMSFLEEFTNKLLQWIFLASLFTSASKKGKAVPLQAWNGPEGSRKLRFPDFMTATQDSRKVVSLTHRHFLPQEILLVLIYVRDWVDPRTIVRSEGFYVNKKFHWHYLESNQRPSNL